MPSPDTVDIRRLRSSLVAVFTKAKPQNIWHLNLDHNHNFTLAVRNADMQAADAAWELGMTSPGGAFQSIAKFSSREDAEDAFARIGETLAEGRYDWVLPPLKILGLTLLALILLQWAWAWFSRPPSHQALQPAPVARTQNPTVQPLPRPVAGLPQAPVQPQPPAKPLGMPLPADDVLQPPKP